MSMQGLGPPILLCISLTLIFVGFERVGYHRGYVAGQKNPIKEDKQQSTAYYNWYYAELNVRYYTELNKVFKSSNNKGLLNRWIALRDKWLQYYPNGWENLTEEIEDTLYIESDSIEINETTPVIPRIMKEVQKKFNDELTKPNMKMPQ